MHDSTDHEDDRYNRQHDGSLHVIVNVRTSLSKYERKKSTR
ncbi:hypothetical protein [Paenibacillus periandrae]|nr:hypothetical protein [Paenibacillus periandrae]